MSFPRYEKYKASGVEWLGDVPAHWGVVPLGKLTLSRCDGPFGSGLKSEHYTDNGVRVIRLQNIRVTGFDGSDCVYVDAGYFARELTGHEVKGGDLLIAGLGDDNSCVGRACVAPGDISPAIVKADCFRFRLDVSRCLPSFAALALNTSSLADAGILSSGSTRARIPLSTMGTRCIPVPPVDEQVAITTFLACEIAKLATLVGDQQRLIELLKEKRQAVISHAVTKGLNPNAKMKPSGVEWLGDVPAHWTQTRLRFLFRATKRQDRADMPVLSVYRDYGVILKESRDDNLNKTPENLSAYQLVKPGDLVINKMKAWQGSLGMSDFEGITSPDYVVFEPRHAEASEFLHLLLRSHCMVSTYRSISTGVRPQQWRLEPDQFLGLTVFLPPVNEQRRIGAWARTETDRAERLIAEADRAVALLRERRTALISAAVTGQIDVRAIASEVA